jgi:hypothetical protein
VSDDRMLPDWIDSYMAYVDNTEPAEAFKLWTAIFCIVACLKRKCFLDWGTITFYPNMYVVLVGPSGCRKGTAMGPGFNMLTELNVRMAAEATTRESLIRELCRTGSETSVSEEGNLELHSSLSIFSQELSVFLGYNNMQLMSDLTDWYDCRARWRYSTKDKALSDDIINVWVSLFGATTPSLIQTSLPHDAIGLGLTSRIIFVFEQKKGKSVPAPFLTEEAIALKPKLLHDLERILMLSGQFRYSSSFLANYIKWYQYQEKNPPFQDERLAGYMERRPNHILKLCMIMSASRSSEMIIREVDLERALIILTETERKMPQVFSGLGKSQLAPIQHRVMHILALRDRMTYMELYNRVSNDVDTMGFDKILKSIEASGYARTVHEGKVVVIERISDEIPFV